MKITFLGTGTSQGVPVIACKCHVCLSKNLKDKRLRSSVLIEFQNKTIVIDTGPDFRQQMLRENVEKLDAVYIRIPIRTMLLVWMIYDLLIFVRKSQWIYFVQMMY